VIAGLLAASVLEVLFVGNSLTYANDLPEKVASLTRSAGVEMKVRTIAFPDHSLGDHWARGDAAKAIRTGRFDFVVLQQGPSAAPENREILRADARRFAALIREHGGRPALYLVWPSRQRAGDWDGVVASHAAAAESADATLLPVGDAWRRALSCDPPLALYGRDGFHPSALGTDLAALVIAAGLTQRPPSSFRAALTIQSSRHVPPERVGATVTALEESAAQALSPAPQTR